MNDFFEFFVGVLKFVLVIEAILIFVICVFYQLFCFLERRLGKIPAVLLYVIASAVLLFSVFSFWWAIGIFVFGLLARQFGKEISAMGEAERDRFDELHRK